MHYADAMQFRACKLVHYRPIPLEAWHHAFRSTATQSTGHPLPLPLAPAVNCLRTSLRLCLCLCCFPFLLFFQRSSNTVERVFEYLHLTFHTHACCIVPRLVPRKAACSQSELRNRSYIPNRRTFRSPLRTSSVLFCSSDWHSLSINMPFSAILLTLLLGMSYRNASPTWESFYFLSNHQTFSKL